jgi:hypothetical protein
LITAKKIQELELSDNRSGGDPSENPYTIAIIRVGDLAGASSPELNRSGYKLVEKERMIPLPGIYDLEPFSGPEEPLDLPIELYQMEPIIES